MNSSPTFVVDRTHMGRRASGIERVTAELFSAEALAPLAVGGAGASGGRLGMMARQSLLNPLQALSRPNTIWIFPGYPPPAVFSFMRERTVLYVHDLFLLTRRQDLNAAARYYMAPRFRAAVARLRWFLVNSETTRQELARYVTDDAWIGLYRPPASDVFGLAGAELAARDSAKPLIVGALGTIEPRKNFLAAARICAALASRLACPVELHIVGRPGWGTDAALLSDQPHVRLHGFLPDAAARAVIGTFDLFLCTSHDEGLGLPLLEAQYGGLPVVAPDKPVFREVLGESGVFVDPLDPASAASRMAALLASENWRERYAAAARANIARWNRNASADRARVVNFLAELARERADSRGSAGLTNSERHLR